MAVKQDIVRSLASRLEMHWDSLIEEENGSPEGKLMRFFGGYFSYSKNVDFETIILAFFSQRISRCTNHHGGY